MTDDASQSREQADILVVDDSVKNLKILADFLTNQGFRVRPAANGLIALRSVAESAPDLILLDVKMPGMDGYEVCARLKADEKTRQVPVLFISGLEKTSNKVKGFNAGGIDYITKPFQFEEVLARVRIHLELRSLQVQLERSHSALEARVDERTAELTQAYQELQTSKNRYRDLFENSPVAIWELDYSKVKNYLEDLKVHNVEDIERYLDKHPDTIRRCARMVTIHNVNRQMMALFRAPDKHTLLEELSNAFETLYRDIIKSNLVAIWNCETKFCQDYMFTTLDDKNRFVKGSWSVSPGHEKTYSRVLSSLIDITQIKRAEERNRRQLAALRRWQNMILDREDRVQELKREVNEQLERQGEPIRYLSQQ